MISYYEVNMNLKLKKLKFLSYSLPFLFAAFLFVLFILYYSDKIYPGIWVNGIYAGSKTKGEVSEILSSQIRAQDKITINAKEKSFELALRELDFSYDYEKTANLAFSIYRSKDYLTNLANRLLSPFTKREIGLQIKIDEEKLDEYLQIVSEEAGTEASYPSVQLTEGNVEINRGSAGEKIDRASFKIKLLRELSIANFSPILVPFEKVDPTLNDREVEILQKRAEKFMGTTLTLSYKDEFIKELKEDTVLTFLDARQEFNQDKIGEFISKEVAPKINREPQNAVFKFLPAQAGEEGRVVEFLPAHDGLTLDLTSLKNLMVEGLAGSENSEGKGVKVEIPVLLEPPKVTTDQVNNLGIKELLGRGKSHFRGSISPRIHNISLASSKFNGILVAPEEIFSFNKALGDVSVYTGYKQAYIIRDGRTVLGDGGGVCQVSTTLFRALLKAGLPIIERRAHSYRVSYYEQDSPPGLDATVYDPTTDLKFKNDTPGHILIQTIFDASTSTLIFEIYGTSDARVVTLSKPITTSSVAPPEDLYVDDPSVPIGQVKQIDYKAWGAKVVFDYKVERNGQVIHEKTFASNYRPWQAVYLRGTGPAQ